MHPSYNFDIGLAKSLYKAIKILSGFKPGKLIKLYQRYKKFQKLNKRRARLYQDKSIVIPPFIILSATMKCNLTCAGCYSRDYSLKDELSINDIDRLFYQAEELGISFFVITGGEPLLREGITELLLKHPDIIFFFFTNATLINQQWIQMIKKADHIIPILSVEGNEEQTDSRRGQGVYKKVMHSMAELKLTGKQFGFSTMVTSENMKTIIQTEFIDKMIEKGCRIGYFVGFVPSAKKADTSLVPSLNQQRIKQKKKLIIIHMPDDEYEMGGTCMAAGRGFLHINAQGYAEPCPFSHWASDSIKTKSLKQILQSPFFKYIRDHSELLKKPKMGCALYEQRKKIKKIVKKLNIEPTD